MGTIVQRSLSDGTLRYRAEIRINRKDFPTYKESKTFNTKRIAEKWVKKREVEIENNPDFLNGNQHEKSIKLSDAIDLYLNEKPKNKLMPNVIGKTKEQVIDMFNQLNYQYILEGTGKAIKQEPEAGVEINSDVNIRIEFFD